MASQVLIVDDEPELLRAIVVRLKAAGFACEPVPSGQHALTLLERWQPDAIVVDLLMPEMDGYELCRRLKDDTRTAAIPIVVLTAVPAHGLDARLQQLGVNRIMHKPFESNELVEAVRTVMTKRVGGLSHD